MSPKRFWIWCNAGVQLRNRWWRKCSKWKDCWSHAGRPDGGPECFIGVSTGSEVSTGGGKQGSSPTRRWNPRGGQCWCRGSPIARGSPIRCDGKLLAWPAGRASTSCWSSSKWGAAAVAGCSAGCSGGCRKATWTSSRGPTTSITSWRQRSSRPNKRSKRVTEVFWVLLHPAGGLEPLVLRPEGLPPAPQGDPVVYGPAGHQGGAERQQGHKGILLHKCNMVDINLALVNFFGILPILMGYKPWWGHRMVSGANGIRFGATWLWWRWSTCCRWTTWR